MPTENQRKAAELMAKKLVAKGSYGKINKKEIMKEAGYGKAAQKVPSKVTESEGFKECLDPIVKRLEKAREDAITRLPQKIDKATYSDLVTAADKFTKNIELLGGNPTSNEKVSFTWEE